MGVKRLIENSECKLQVTTLSRRITILGQNIKIVKLIDGDLAFLGSVEKVEFDKL